MPIQPVFYCEDCRKHFADMEALVGHACEPVGCTSCKE